MATKTKRRAVGALRIATGELVLVSYGSDKSQVAVVDAIEEGKAPSVTVRKWQDASETFSKPRTFPEWRVIGRPTKDDVRAMRARAALGR